MVAIRQAVGQAAHIVLEKHLRATSSPKGSEERKREAAQSLMRRKEWRLEYSSVGRVLP